MRDSIWKAFCFFNATLSFSVLVGSWAAANDLLDDHQHQPGKRVTISVDLPVMPCSTITRLISHGDQRGGELEGRIREVMGKWADHFPITDEDRKDYHEKLLLAQPLKDDQKAYAFARELFTSYTLQECK